GRVVADRDTHQTSHPRVFLAGEALRGPGSAIEAVADGHRVAEVVARFLETGAATKPEADGAVPLEPYPEETLARLRKIASAAPETEPFAPDEPLIGEEAAWREGGRCLGCLAGATIDEARCASCLTCFRVCPLDAVEIGQAMASNPVRCQACGLCAAVCPANAISLPVWEPAKEAPAAAGQALGRAAIVCLHDGHQEINADEVLRVPCIARLKPVEVVRLFRRGHKSVSLHACAKDACKYGVAWKNLESLAGCVRELVRATLPEAELKLCLPPGS
ncbi:MAG: hydrogenase iron-sulfur subunit, partial [Planctomycetes bacterium]|nr:hydrogenase iron-sulfur subunit [Planctomycetota bacterium]